LYYLISRFNERYEEEGGEGEGREGYEEEEEGYKEGGEEYKESGYKGGVYK
jgi:hypothetical protein